MTRREWFALTAALPLQATPAAQAPDIDQFFNDYFETWVKSDPEQATSMRFFAPNVQNELDSRLSEPVAQKWLWSSRALPGIRPHEFTPASWIRSRMP